MSHSSKSQISLLASALVLATFAVGFGSEPTTSKKENKPTKYKLNYTLSNSGGGQLTIQVKAFRFEKEDSKSKIYIDRVSNNSQKSMTAVVEEGIPYGFEVLVLNGQTTVMNQLFVVSPTPTLDNPMEGEQFSEWVCPLSEQVDIAYFNGSLVWSTNPQHK